MKSMIRRAILGALASPMIAPSLHRIFRGSIFCLMLHRVSEKDARRLAPNEGMKVSPSCLERFILDAKSKGYRFLSMTQLHRAMEGETEWPTRGIVVTLDDGYRDNLTEGLPIFERHSVPFIVYLSTAFVGPARSPWWYALEELILAKDELWHDEELIPVGSIEAKEALFMRVREAALLSTMGAGQYISALCERNGYVPEVSAPSFLSWDEVRRLHSHPLAEIGAHGHEHLNLQGLSHEEVRAELVVARDEIARHTGCVPDHYSYAYGLFDETATSVVRELGAKTCVTTASGCITSGERDRLALPRFMLTEGMSMDELIAQAAYMKIRGASR